LPSSILTGNWEVLERLQLELVYSWIYLLKVSSYREAGEEEEDELGRMLDDPSTDPDTVNKLVMPHFFMFCICDIPWTGCASDVYTPITGLCVSVLPVVTGQRKGPVLLSLHGTQLVMFIIGRWSGKWTEGPLCTVSRKGV
jgi:hypothetical protein